MTQETYTEGTVDSGYITTLAQPTPYASHGNIAHELILA
jgi:hypothetical protein